MEEALTARLLPWLLGALVFVALFFWGQRGSRRTAELECINELYAQQKETVRHAAQTRAKIQAAPHAGRDLIISLYEDGSL
ncbi:hypothetical protein FACS1894186_6480 [Alphaproteobacteria bacterium]|nr:hypothetical protein FACS1894186_6480 [Alphaproteobacteria bacterium]